MSIITIMKQRRTITSYRDIPLSQEQWMKLIDAASWAPNAGNIQDWRFIVVNSASKREEIAHACHEQMWMTTAPVHIVCCSDTQRTTHYFGTRGERLYSIQNVAAAAQNILLTATDMGLATAWVGSFEEADIRKTLGIPDEIRIHAILTVGYPNEIKPLPQKQAFDAFCFLNGWGSRLNPDELHKFKFEYADIAAIKTQQTKGLFKSLWDKMVKK